jgi:hypothetical protein
MAIPEAMTFTTRCGDRTHNKSLLTDTKTSGNASGALAQSVRSTYRSCLLKPQYGNSDRNIAIAVDKLISKEGNDRSQIRFDYPFFLEVRAGGRKAAKSAVSTASVNYPTNTPYIPIALKIFAPGSNPNPRITMKPIEPPGFVIFL